MEPEEKRNLQDSFFSPEQERVNTIIHCIGVILGIIGVPILVILALNNNHTNSIIGSCIYGFCFLMTFTFSTLYHSCLHQRRKCLFELLDYISIYFLIAGTYTPFVLSYMPNASGVFLLTTV